MEKQKVKDKSYYIQWLSVTFRHSWGISNWVVGIAGATIAYIISRYPEWELIVMELAWQIPLGILGALFITRLFLAPYWMHKTLKQSCTELQNKLDQGAVKCTVMENLGNYLDEGNALYDKYPTQQEADGWASKIEKYLEENLGTDYISRFRSYIGLENIKDNIDLTGLKPRNFIEVRLMRIQEFIKELRLG